MAVFNSFKNGFVAYKQQKLSSAARSWNYSVCLCHVGRTAESGKTRQEQKLRVRLPLNRKTNNLAFANDMPSLRLKI